MKWLQKEYAKTFRYLPPRLKLEKKNHMQYFISFMVIYFVVNSVIWIKYFLGDFILERSYN